jgi:hypothetical protein
MQSSPSIGNPASKVEMFSAGERHYTKRRSWGAPTDMEGVDSGEVRKIPKSIVIPKRGFFARGICGSAAGNQQIPRR